MKSRKNAKGMKTPPFLRPGDRIAIVAPARWVTKEQIAPALATIEQWGFESVVYTQVYKKNHQFAGSDVARASALQKALDDPSVKAVVFARGGYGTCLLYTSLLPIPIAVKERKKINVNGELWWDVVQTTGQPFSMKN